VADTQRYLVTWQMRSLQGAWEEHAYIESTSADAALDSANHTGLRRAALLASGADVGLVGTLVERVPEDQPPREEAFNFDIAQFAGYFADNSMDMPWTGIYCRFTAAGGQRREYLLRGVPDVVTVQNWDSPPTSGKWTDSFNVWRSEFIGTAYRMRVKSKAGPIIPIQQIVSDTDGELLVSSPAHGLVTGQYINFIRVRAAYLTIRGNHRVIRVNAGTFKVLGYNVSAVAFLKGSYRVLAYTYAGIADVTLGRKGERPVGGRKFELRGKAPAGKS
jgi:hypothetical protein